MERKKKSTSTNIFENETHILPSIDNVISSTKSLDKGAETVGVCIFFSLLLVYY